VGGGCHTDQDQHDQAHALLPVIAVMEERHPCRSAQAQDADRRGWRRLALRRRVERLAADHVVVSDMVAPKSPLSTGRANRRQSFDVMTVASTVRPCFCHVDNRSRSWDPACPRSAGTSRARRGDRRAGCRSRLQHDDAKNHAWPPLSPLPLISPTRRSPS
jgi:hypothetical protein